jgi:hypothetical protein
LLVPSTKRANYSAFAGLTEHIGAVENSDLDLRPRFILEAAE